uniref:Odorant-binding protein 20 n=1 Tax=Dastarcus helophoroides TaxID=1169899 RepID=A0A1I9HZP8_9CUCU|nr:odorant-binding protein 20 [Dastarcus helophoroides]
MKPIHVACYFFCLLSSALCAELTPKEKMQAEAKKLVAACKDKVKASDADVEALKAQKIPETHEGLCLIECLFDGAKIMQNGKFDKNGMMTAFSAALKEQGKSPDKLKSLGDACEKDVGEGDKDKCVTAKMLVECFAKKAKEMNLEYPKDV